MGGSCYEESQKPFLCFILYLDALGICEIFFFRNDLLIELSELNLSYDDNSDDKGDYRCSHAADRQLDGIVFAASDLIELLLGELDHLVTAILLFSALTLRLVKFLTLGRRSGEIKLFIEKT